ncbi:phage tail protein [Acinetobacter sp. ANC 4973]|uniref:phage tail-collar fiber domain-containing protein n=1 Tax=Acinetobacter sp. ANC 4973 TaxID=1977871 RepID=UPI000A34E7DA|nr:phage tail protein [Acinetobacter sp. ANC 4973]OTH00821.1 phage tail protein [Acinetobacter sp. ANC 4973]
MYKSIHTEYALSLLAQAEAMGTKIQLTHAAIGDGGGIPVFPKSDQKQLVRERYRATLNRVYQDPERQNKFTAEFILPINVGGWVCREIGIFDNNGNLFIVGNLPDTFKPDADNGTFEDYVFRIPFFVGNAETVQINIDPNIVTATHQWIVNTITPAYLLPGGTTGQVLKKLSNGDGDTTWGDASDAEVFVNTIEEEQSLVVDQFVVELSTTTTHGAAVYINGERITNKSGEDGWLATSDTSLTLGKTYPDSKILIVQNEPLGAAPYPLAQKNNLSDILNKPEARQNLGVMSADEAKHNDCPPGTVITLASSSIPTGYRLLKCNGAAVSRSVYADLFAVIGTEYGAGDGIYTFNIPDARSEFPRYADDGRGIDTDRVVGSKQYDDVKLTGSFQTIQPSGFINEGIFRKKSGSQARIAGSASNFEHNEITVSGGKETRPRNIAWLACIRY